MLAKKTIAREKYSRPIPLVPMLAAGGMRVEGAVERVADVSAGVCFRRLGLDGGVADAEAVMQARVQGRNDGLTL